MKCDFILPRFRRAAFGTVLLKFSVSMFDCNPLEKLTLIFAEVEAYKGRS
jgi:hypothetical protein